MSQLPGCMVLHLRSLCRYSLSVGERLKTLLQSSKIDCLPYEEEDDPVVSILLLVNTISLPQELSVYVREHVEKGHYVMVLNIGDLPVPSRTIWELLEQGVGDIIDFNLQPKVADIIRSRLERQQKIEQILNSDFVRSRMVGSSPIWIATLRQIIEIAYFTNDTVLIMGESGTGKELAANLIHSLAPRTADKELVLLDCSTIVPELAGSEFFGHEKGAFTNAFALREGAFGLADGSTLFLDEIGELPINIQSELLRVIQEGTYKRVGSNHWKPTKFRLVSATNRTLLKEVQHKRFREDLYYRISTWVITLPSLSARRDDIPGLTQFFLEKILGKGNVPEVDPLLMSFLASREYPGNVRELQQLVTRMAHRYVGKGPLTVSDLPADDRPKAGQMTEALEDAVFINYLQQAINRGWHLKDIINHVSDQVKDIAIKFSNDDLQAAAYMLNVSDRTMQMYKASRKPGADTTVPSGAMDP